jgi:hypothetical protein
MRMALGIDKDDASEEIPSWLTAENAKTVLTAPCIKALTPDLGCWYCRPTPKPAEPTGDSADAASNSVAGGDDTPVATDAGSASRSAESGAVSGESAVGSDTSSPTEGE